MADPVGSRRVLSLWRGEFYFPPTMRTIAEDIAERHGVRLNDMQGRCKKPYVVDARHEAMALCRLLLGFSCPRIGRFFNRNHKTVSYAVAKYERMMDA